MSLPRNREVAAVPNSLWRIRLSD